MGLHVNSEDGDPWPLAISDIPAESDGYILGSRSAPARAIDRYRLKKDKASDIVDDLKDWADEVGNPRNLVDLVCNVTGVAVGTDRIVDKLSRPADS